MKNTFCTSVIENNKQNNSHWLAKKVQQMTFQEQTGKKAQSKSKNGQNKTAKIYS